MFASWGSWVARFRWPVLAVALVAVISAGVWGLGVFGELTEGGYNDPNSESTQAADVVRDAFGAQGGDLVVIYTPTKGKIDDAGLAKRVKDSLGKLPKSAVTGSSSYWSTKSAQYAAKDKSSAVAVITLAGDDDAAKMDAFREVDDRFAVQGATVRLSGATVIADASSARSTEDLGTAEAISLPITLVLLILIFGSLVAASLPVLVGGASVLGSLGILHAISASHDVNSFAVNVASLLGLGMAIDYGLFMVGRFREEQAEGRTPAEAVSRTVGTAGRTVVFSATLLMIALAGLLLFPQGFLKSLAYGGLAAVFLAAVLSLTLLPAMLAILGPRVDKIPVRLPRRSRTQPGDIWTGIARFVLRRPLAVALPILAFLLLLAAPIRGVHFGESDERILPANDPARVATETLKADYPQFTGDNVQIVLRDAADPASFAVALRQIPGIAQISPARKQKGVTLFTATLQTKDAYSSAARDAVDAIRALPVPPGARLLVGGTTARNVDSLDATAGRLPLMILMLVGATLVLMFLAFGSVLLPIKAVLMSALSLTATCGALVWIFEDGHGSGLLDITPAPLEVGIVVLMAAVVFGLSTDYEVFLLSRMVEARTRGASTDEAVTTGLARTGRVISAAAVLLIVVTGAFALSAVSTMRFVGVGMIIALLLDATVVRLLLVPAVLRLIGDAAWWAPGPLRRLQQRAGLTEYAAEPAPAAAPESRPGRHALDETQVIRYSPYGAGVHALPVGAAPALPAPAAAFALPAPPADDSTQVFARVDDTAILMLPEATFSTPDESTAHEPIVDAEIIEDETPAPDTWAVSDAIDVEQIPDPDLPWDQEPAPAGFPSDWFPAAPASAPPAPDWTVPDDDGFFFSPRPTSPATRTFSSTVSGYDTWEPTDPDTGAAPAADEDESRSTVSGLAPAEGRAAAWDEAARRPDEPTADRDEPEPVAPEPPAFVHDHYGASRATPTPSWAGPSEPPTHDTSEPPSTGDELIHTYAEPDAQLPAPDAPTRPAGTETFGPFTPEPARLSDVFVPRTHHPATTDSGTGPSNFSTGSTGFGTGSDFGSGSTDFGTGSTGSGTDFGSGTGTGSAGLGTGSTDFGTTGDLTERGTDRPATLADQTSARRSPTARAANPADHSQERVSDAPETLSPRPAGREGQTPPRRPATLGDQPLPSRLIPAFPESPSMTDQEPQPQATAEPSPAATPGAATPSPAAAAATPPATPNSATTPSPASSATSPTPDTPDPAVTAPAPPGSTATTPSPAVSAATTPTPAPATPSPAPPAPSRAAATPGSSVPAAFAPPPPPATTPTSPVPAAFAPPPPPLPAAEPTPAAPPAPPLRAAPYVMPAAATTPPPPITPSATPTPPPPATITPRAPQPQQFAPPAPFAPTRRPVNLADHLRESRPADLSDYTEGRIPRMRAPEEQPPRPGRRPATLADHLSARASAEESTHDLRDHATRE